MFNVADPDLRRYVGSIQEAPSQIVWQLVRKWVTASYLKDKRLLQFSEQVVHHPLKSTLASSKAQLTILGFMQTRRKTERWRTHIFHVRPVLLEYPRHDGLGDANDRYIFK
ncbi:hypothetical protein PMIN04_011248 [Paraphaeosphaeria minitans]